ncbi:hypothetical protein [Candidatus Poriferisocius sp.]|uniref:hypothetical protein n=1 Tax=Candidatus Poriferisocius sp. TaxID=3101276 RepID=UPI003B01FBC0
MRKLLVCVVITGLITSVTPAVVLAHDPVTTTHTIPAVYEDQEVTKWVDEEYTVEVNCDEEGVTKRVPYTGLVPSTASASYGVRIGARKTSSGIKVELAVQRRGTGLTGSWGSTIYPTSRFFPASTTVGRWLHTSAVTVGGTSVRIAARRATSTTVEVALQQRVGNSWGAYIYILLAVSFPYLLPLGNGK